MRKRNITCLFDNIFWYLIYSLPVWVYLISFAVPSVSRVLYELLNTFGLGSSVSITYTTLSDLFGSTGLLPLFDNSLTIQLFSWFINCMIIHLAVDFLLFIPRLCHKFMSVLTQDKD